MKMNFAIILKVTGLLLFIGVFTAALSLHGAPLPVFPKTVAFSSDGGDGVDAAGPGDAVHHYPDIAGEGAVTKVIRDERDGRYLIIQVEVGPAPWSKQYSPVSSEGEVSIEAWGFLAASVYLVPLFPEVAGGREHAPERASLRLLPPSERLNFSPRNSWKWSVW